MDQHPIVKIHLSQHYSQDDGILDTDEIFRKYPTFSNEALYVVDCKQAQLEVLSSSFHKITNIDSSYQNELLPLYEHVSSKNQEKFDAFTLKIVDASIGQKSDVNFVQDDIVSCLYKTHDDRVILKSTCLLSRDSTNHIRYTLGKLTDVTGMIDASNFNYKFIGPNSKKLFAIFNDVSEVEQVLTARELQILVLIGDGQSSQEIANNLFISAHTVRTHRKNILQKLETSASLKAYNKAKDMGLF